MSSKFIVSSGATGNLEPKWFFNSIIRPLITSHGWASKCMQLIFIQHFYQTLGVLILLLLEIFVDIVVFPQSYVRFTQLHSAFIILFSVSFNNAFIALISFPSEELILVACDTGRV